MVLLGPSPTQDAALFSTGLGPCAPATALKKMALLKIKCMQKKFMHALTCGDSEVTHAV